MPKTVIANWKMHGLSADGRALARAVCADADKIADRVGLALCPPATLLTLIGTITDGTAVSLGAQDCHAETSGPFTGDIAAEMLADLGCALVVVGHSERREGHGETDDQVRLKAEAAHRAGLRAVICIGETLEQRDSGAAEATVLQQLTHSVPTSGNADNTLLAYEPLWAIGTGRTADTETIARMHNAIRDSLKQRFADGEDIAILYGGSVKPENAAAIMATSEVGGALVGGASLNADDFLAIAGAAAEAGTHSGRI